MTTKSGGRTAPREGANPGLTPEESALVVRIGVFVKMRWLAIAGVLIASLILLGSIAHSAWATPSQDPHRQTIPTRTPTSAPGTPTSPPPTATPATPQSPTATPAATQPPTVAPSVEPSPTALRRSVLL